VPDAADTPPFRILPAINERNEGFWTSGRDGVLRFQRCQDCGYYLHPPGVVCPECWSKNIEYEPVSGRATVVTFTINHQPWMPVPELPFVLAIVGIEEQDGLRLTTNIVNCPVDDVYIGMPVTVRFEAHADEDVWIPLFEPLGDASGDAAADAAGAA
jgi:uncharacterized OB-fold protein